MLKTKEELSHQLKDNKGVYNTYGVFKNVEEDLNSGLLKLKDCNKRKVTYKEFRKVIGLYFKYLMLDLIDGKRFRLYNRFGELRIAKRKIDRFIPKPIKIRFVKGKYVSEKVDPLEYLKKFNWFWYYLNWEVDKKWRTHELKQGQRFKSAMMKRVERGFDYIDYTPRYKGEGMIRKIK